MKTSDIAIPSLFYIRGVANDEHLARLREAVVTSADPTIWPFPPITVRKNPLVSKADHASYGKPYELVDGMHRLLTAVVLKFADIPADIRTCTDTEAVVLQWTMNLHGLPLTKDQRNLCIKTLAAPPTKVPQVQIAKLLHLSQGSISQILGGTQATKGGKHAKAQTGGKVKPKVTETGEMKKIVTGFLSHADAIIELFYQHQRPLSEAILSNVMYNDICAALIDCLPAKGD